MADTSHLLTEIKMRLEDSGGTSFTDDEYKGILDSAVEEMCHTLNPIYLDSLCLHISANTNSDGKAGLFGYGVTDKRQVLSAQVATTGEIPRFVDIISEEKAQKVLDNKYMGLDKNYPVAYIASEGGTSTNLNIYLFPQAEYTVIVKIMANPFGFGTESTTLILDSKMDDVILDLAEYRLWKIDNKQERSQLAYKSAIDRINVLNEGVNV